MKALQQQQQQQQQKLSGWGNVSKPAGTAKSLLEIQQEEARQMQKQQQQQQQHQQPNRARNNTVGSSSFPKHSLYGLEVLFSDFCGLCFSYFSIVNHIICLFFFNSIPTCTPALGILFGAL